MPASGAAGAKRATGRPRGKAGGGAGFGRWWKVALLVALVTIGLPLGVAIFGEIVALLGGAVLFGFLLGRWTAK